VGGQLHCELTLITDGDKVVAEVIGGSALALAVEETRQICVDGAGGDLLRPKHGGLT
jgi:hypothetical protein